MLQLCSVIDVFKKSPRITLPLSVAIGIILFMPAAVYLRLGLNSPQGTFRTTLGVFFILSFVSFISWLVVAPVVQCSKWIRGRMSLTRLLRALSEDERSVLREHIHKGLKSMDHSVGSGVALGLVHKGILYQPSSIGRPGSIPLNVTDQVWEYLQKHPCVLGNGSEEGIV